MAGGATGSDRAVAADVGHGRLGCPIGPTAERRAVRSVEEQQARVSAAAVAPRPVRVAIAEAQGLMCAEEVVTERPLPGFDQAAIDGYAVRSVDVLGVGEGSGRRSVRHRTARTERGRGIVVWQRLTLPVMGTIEAGARTPSRLQPRQAVRVQTGAPLPTLADAVLPLRWTDGGQSRVRVLRGVRSGAYVRRTGDDVQPGDVAVRAGTIIGAGPGRAAGRGGPRPGAGASRGRGCRCMAVGGELVDISRTPGNGQVYDVNSYALAAAARDAGAEVNRVGIVSSDARELGEVVEGQVNRAEIVVIAGAVGGAAAEARALGAVRARRDGGHPGRHASRLRPGLRAAGPRRCADVPAARQPGQRAGGLRGDGPAVDPVVAGQAAADAPGRPGAHAVADHLGGRPQGIPARPADARSGHRRVPGAGARRRAGRVVAPAGDARRGKLSGRGSQRGRADSHRRDRRRRVPGSARLSDPVHRLVNLLRSNSQHPGWPTAVGPLRVAAGVIRLRPVRLRDARAMEPAPAGRSGAPGTVGAQHRGRLDVRDTRFRRGRRCVRACGPKRARAGCCRMSSSSTASSAAS